jgi:sterol 14-demethylase
VPLLGHLLDFVKGPVGMIDNLRSQYRSMFTIRVGPQRITFMIGAVRLSPPISDQSRLQSRLQSRPHLGSNLASQGPQLQFIKAKDEVLDQAPVYGFTIPVFGEGIIYDSPLEERQQQVSAPGVPP